MNKTELINKIASRPGDYTAVEELIDFITDSDTVILSAKKIKDNLQIATSESSIPNKVELETRLNLVQSIYADAQDSVAEEWLKDDFVNCLIKLLA